MTYIPTDQEMELAQEMAPKRWYPVEPQLGRREVLSIQRESVRRLRVLVLTVLKPSGFHYWTLTRLAEQLSASPHTIWKWLKGIHLPGRGNALKLRDFLNRLEDERKRVDEELF